MLNTNISKSFIEKIMLVVTAINGCPYCAWFHAKKALEAGLSKEDIKTMLALQFDARATDFETIALLYAQNYTETNRNPDQAITKKLYEFYGKKTARHIITIVRMIYFGNLSGNTFDAFLSRLKGKPALNSTTLFELLFFIISAPIFLPILPYVKKYRP
ncbi:MAG: carboxymuconolactone decarboxylase family protein [Spirochaetota bacterium]